MTHDDLVERAVRWLKGGAKFTLPQRVFDGSDWVNGDLQIINVRCPLVLSEICTHTPETPDAIGWCHSGGTSILVECKVSVSDWYSDRQKPFRKEPDKGVGDYRWFLTPKGLVKPTMSVPEGWGLLEVCGKVIRVKTWPDRMKKDAEAENTILYSVINRLRYGGDNYQKPIR